MTVYYVDGVDGADVNAGTSEGSGNAWKTIQHAESTIVAGDTVYVKANGSYAETVTLAASYGTTVVCPAFEGYTTTPGDGGRATIDATGLNYAITDGGLTRNFRVFRNFRFTGASQYNVYMDTGDYGVFINCEFDNATLSGARVDNNFSFINCTFRDNGSAGVETGNAPIFHRCLSYNNTGTGISGVAGYVTGCVAYNNSASAAAFEFGSAANNAFVANSTIEGTSGQPCLRYYRSYALQIWDNIFHNGSYGIDAGNGLQGGTFHQDHNLFYGQSVGDTDGSVTWDGPDTISGENPGFTDAAGGDFTISSSSPAKDTGSDPGISA